MKSTDYKSYHQASDYFFNRFKGGLQVVADDEQQIISSWLSKEIKSKICLDLGTGTGRVISTIVRFKPRKIYALDNSPSMLKFFKEVFSRWIKKKVIYTLHAPSNKIPLDNSSVDVVTSLHLFKHLPLIEPTLKEINRVLKPNGYLLFDMLNKQSAVKYNIGSCFALAPFELFKKLDKIGFEILKVEYLHPFGESVYAFDRKGNLIHYMEKMLNLITPKLGTKVFIFARKKQAL